MLSNNDKYKFLNFNISKENFVTENAEIKNQNKKQENNNLSLISSKMPDINELIKSFNILEDEDSQSNISSLDLRLCQNISNKNINSIENKSKNEKTSQKFEVVKVSQEKEKKIFSIKKKMKLGRIKKDSNKIGKHSKYRRDNIIRRFKVRLMNNIYDYINKSFLINNRKDKNKHINMLKRLSSNNVKLMSKKDNMILLNSSIKYIFSQKPQKYLVLIQITIKK